MSAAQISSVVYPCSNVTVRDSAFMFCCSGILFRGSLETQYVSNYYTTIRGTLVFPQRYREELVDIRIRTGEREGIFIISKKLRCETEFFLLLMRLARKNELVPAIGRHCYVSAHEIEIDTLGSGDIHIERIIKGEYSWGPHIFTGILGGGNGLASIYL